MIDPMSKEEAAEFDLERAESLYAGPTHGLYRYAKRLMIERDEAREMFCAEEVTCCELREALQDAYDGRLMARSDEWVSRVKILLNPKGGGDENES